MTKEEMVAAIKEMSVLDLADLVKTLEDEFGLIPLMVFPQVYERQEYEFKSPFLVVKGKLSRREGTHNVVVTSVKPFRVLDKVPHSKNWG